MTVFAARPGNSSPLTSPTPPMSPSAGVFAIRSADVAAPSLRRDHRRPVLDERVGVDQVGKVLASGPFALGMSLLDRSDPRRVEPGIVAGDDFCEIRTDGLDGRNLGNGRFGATRRRRQLIWSCRRRAQFDHRIAGRQRRSDRCHHGGDGAGRRCHHIVVHLHRLDQRHDGTSTDPVAFGDEHLDDRSLELGRDRDPCRTLFRHGRRSSTDARAPTPSGASRLSERFR